MNTTTVDESMARLIAAYPLLFRGKEPEVSGFLPSGLLRPALISPQ